MRRRIRAWRRRQRSGILFVPVPRRGTILVSNGMRDNHDLRMIEVYR